MPSASTFAYLALTDFSFTTLSLSSTLAVICNVVAVAVIVMLPVTLLPFSLQADINNMINSAEAQIVINL